MSNRFISLICLIFKYITANMNKYILYFFAFTQILSCDLSKRKEQPKKEDKNLKAFEKILTDCSISEKDKESIVKNFYKKNTILISRIIEDSPNQFEIIFRLFNINKYDIKTKEKLLSEYFSLMRKFYNDKKNFSKNELINLLLSVIDNKKDYPKKLKTIVELNNKNNKEDENKKIYSELETFISKHGKPTSSSTINEINKDIDKCLEKYDNLKIIKFINSRIEKINNGQITEIKIDLKPYIDKYKVKEYENITKIFDDLFKEIGNEKNENTIIDKLKKCLRTLTETNIQEYIKNHVNKTLENNDLFDIHIDGIVDKKIKLTIKNDKYDIMSDLDIKDINLKWENDYKITVYNKKNYTLLNFKKSSIIDCFKKFEELSQERPLENNDFYSLFIDYLDKIKDFLKDVDSLENSLKNLITDQKRLKQIMDGVYNTLQDKLFNNVLPYNYITIYKNAFLNDLVIKDRIQKMFKNMGFDAVAVNIDADKKIIFSELKIDINDLVKNKDITNELNNLSNFITQQYQQHTEKFNSIKDEDINNIFSFKTIYSKYKNSGNSNTKFETMKNNYEQQYRLLTFQEFAFEKYKQHIEKIKSDIINNNNFSSSQTLKECGFSAIRTIEDLNMWIGKVYDLITNFYSFIEDDRTNVYPAINNFLKSIFGIKDKKGNFTFYKNSHLLLYMFYSKNSYNNAFDNNIFKLEFNVYKKILDIIFQKDNFLKCENSNKAIKISDNIGNDGYIKVNSGENYDNLNDLKSKVIIIDKFITKKNNDYIIYLNKIQNDNRFSTNDILFEENSKDDFNISSNKIALFFGYDKFKKIKIDYKSNTGNKNNKLITDKIE